MELIGSFQGSGRTDETYLARRDDGQWVELSPLLWFTLSNLDGTRSLTEVADRVTAAWERPVAAEDIDYLIDKKLDPAGLVGTSSGKRQRPDLILALRAKKVLLSARVVSALSRPLRFLFWGPIVVLMTGLFVAVETFAFTSGRLAAGVHETLGRPAALLLVGGLVVCSIFVHEMGHASGCRYGGATPGEMGVGIYVASPAFFTDLSDGYRLGRWGRIRGDLGGVYFNAVYAVALFPFYLATRSPLMFLVMTAMILEILYQMVPFVRSDGYWAVSDLAGVPDLFAPRIRLSPWPGVRVVPVVAPAGQGLGLGHHDRVAHNAAVRLACFARAGSGFVERRARSRPGYVPFGWVVRGRRNQRSRNRVHVHPLGPHDLRNRLLTLRLVRMATNEASGPGHVTKRARRTRCLARAWLVMGAVSLPVAWSAVHIRIH